MEDILPLKNSKNDMTIYGVSQSHGKYLKENENNNGHVLLNVYINVFMNLYKIDKMGQSWRNS